MTTIISQYFAMRRRRTTMILLILVAHGCRSWLFLSQPRLSRLSTTAIRRLAASSNNNNPSQQESLDDDDTHNYGQEETLLCIHFTDATTNLTSYIRSFPFATVLPVQPLMYMPSSNGMILKFLRKPTATKPMMDGGIRIFLTDNILTIKRNSYGQAIPKLLSERTIVLQLLKDLQDQKVNIKSVYHKWMDAL